MSEEEEFETTPPKKPPIALIAFGLTNVVAIVAALYFAFGNGSAEAGEAETKVAAAATAANGAPGPLLKMDGYIVNIGKGEMARYLKAGVAVELASEEDRELFEKSEIVIRNEILMHLSSLEVANTETSEQKKKIERQLKKKIKKRLKSDFVVGVYFTEFVTQ